MGPGRLASQYILDICFGKEQGTFIGAWAFIWVNVVLLKTHLIFRYDTCMLLRSYIITKKETTRLLEQGHLLAHLDEVQEEVLYYP